MVGALAATRCPEGESLLRNDLGSERSSFPDDPKLLSLLVRPFPLEPGFPGEGKGEVSRACVWRSTRRFLIPKNRASCGGVSSEGFGSSRSTIRPSSFWGRSGSESMRTFNASGFEAGEVFERCCHRNQTGPERRIKTWARRERSRGYKICLGLPAAITRSIWGLWYHIRIERSGPRSPEGA